MPDLPEVYGPSEKSRGVALALAAILGPFGAHRFYVGRPRSGALMLATLGGLGIWYLYDIIVVAAGEFEDSAGRRLSLWDPVASPSSDAMERELDALRAEVADLAERVDFAERLLARPETPSPPPAPYRHS